MIETLEKAEAAHMHAATEQAKADFHASVRPIYANEPDRPHPRPIGSCVLLEISGLQIVVTAAHILDEMSGSTALFVAGCAGSLVHIPGSIRATPRPPGGRWKDALDSGYWVPHPAAVAEMGPVEFLRSDRFSLNRASVQDRYYVATGYATSRNRRRVHRETCSISPRLSSYTGTCREMPALAAELGVSGERHLFLHFDKRPRDAAGTRANQISPTGFSGGALLDLGDFTTPDTYARNLQGSARLSGILIEQRMRHRALIAVKIGPIVDGIERDLARVR